MSHHTAFGIWISTYVISVLRILVFLHMHKPITLATLDFHSVLGALHLWPERAALSSVSTTHCVPKLTLQDQSSWSIKSPLAHDVEVWIAPLCLLTFLVFSLPAGVTTRRCCFICPNSVEYSYLQCLPALQHLHPPRTRRSSRLRQAPPCLDVVRIIYYILRFRIFF